MRLKQIVSYEGRLDAIVAKAGSVAEDPELQAHMASYICVLVSGYLEVALRHLFAEYTRKVSHDRVTRAMQRQLDSFQNPKMEKILQLIGAFDQNWADEITIEAGDEVKTAVDSIVANRHNLAHGRSGDISLVRMREYYRKARELVGLVEAKLGL